MSFVVAIYDRNQAYGGPEEGGWWYECGDLVKVSRVFDDQDRACRYAARMSERFDRLRRKARLPLYWSAIYGGGHYGARVFENEAPPYYPQVEPVYE